MSDNLGRAILRFAEAFKLKEYQGCYDFTWWYGRERIVCHISPAGAPYDELARLAEFAAQWLYSRAGVDVRVEYRAPMFGGPLEFMEYTIRRAALEVRRAQRKGRK